MRSEVWRDTDRRRTGMLPFVFEDGMGYERYVDYALGVPMYFVYRDGRYVDASGASFQDFLDGRLPQLPGERPTLDDWSDHLTTLFPEVRLKRFLETRGADSGPWQRICALPALWVGLLYDAQALDAAWELVKDWTADEREALRNAVPKSALQTPFRDTTVQHIARDVLQIARRGLRARRRINAASQDEGIYLDPLDEVAHSGCTLLTGCSSGTTARGGTRSTMYLKNLRSKALARGSACVHPRDPKRDLGRVGFSLVSVS
jgi:glutamate--cysteine ligase